MINDETRRKLYEIGMEEMITALDLQSVDNTYTTLPFDDRIKMLVDYVYQEKYNGKVKRLLKQARFRIPNAEVHDIYYSDRGLDRDIFMELSTCQFIHNNSNIIFQGFTGSGKSYLACSIGRQACKQGIRTRYIRVPDLLMARDEAAEEKMGIGKLLKKYSNYRLLLLDEWLLNDYSDEELHFLFELLERRHEQVSTVFCTQYKLEDWHTRLGGGVLADSIMDRIIHKSFRVYSGSLNMREFYARRT
ncbi:MAG: ATP-binding protein [Desulfotomaculaceae bacterium]|nr:ATP-binding protein [Desulfotomaculaceae bacterium]